MILLVAGVVLLVIVAALATVMNIRAAAHASAAADQVDATTDQLLDALAEVFLDAELASARRHGELLEALASLNGHRESLAVLRDENEATRKQIKAILRESARLNAAGDRLLRKQYSHHGDMDDIIYYVRQQLREAGEVNGR